MNNQARLEAVHMGSKLGLDTVIAAVREEYNEEWQGSPFDLTVYHHDRVAAVVRYLGHGKGSRVLAVADPAADAQRREDEEYMRDYRPAIKNQCDLEQERHERRPNRPLPGEITEGDCSLHSRHPRLTLDEVIAEEMDDWDGGWDHAIWLGEKLMAVIRSDTDGRPEAVGWMGPACAPTPPIQRTG